MSNEAMDLAYGWLSIIAVAASAEGLGVVASCLNAPLEFPSIFPVGESGFAEYDQKLAEIAESVES